MADQRLRARVEFLVERVLWLGTVKPLKAILMKMPKIPSGGSMRQMTEQAQRFEEQMDALQVQATAGRRRGQGDSERQRHADGAGDCPRCD